MATGKFAATEGSGQNAALYTFSEDAITKFLQRIALSDSTGADVVGLNGGAAYDGTNNVNLVGLLRAAANNALSTSPDSIIMQLPYQPVAVSQTAKVLGTTGAAGDTLSGIIIQPNTTALGSIVVLDGTTAVYTYPGGTVNADLRPIIIPLGMVCVGAGWHVTTPASATVLALGKFT